MVILLQSVPFSCARPVLWALVGILLLPCPWDQARADFSDLAREMLSQNKDLYGQRLDTLRAGEERQKVRGQWEWNVAYEFSLDDDGLDTINPTSVQSQQTRSHGLTLSKGLRFGTTFSLRQQFTTVQSQVPKTALFTSFPDRYHLFSQSLELTQDLGRNFLGRQTTWQLKVAEGQKQVAQQQLSGGVQQKLVALYHNYIQARLIQAQAVLQNEAVKRAKRRRRTTKRRVDDGLREPVDLYQAQMAVKTQQEQLRQVSGELASAVEAVANIVHRQVEAPEIPELDLQRDSLPPSPPGRWQENWQLQSLQAQANLARASWRQAKTQVFPDIQLQGRYATNDFSQQSADTWEEGNLAQEGQNQWRVGVQVQWPLSMRAQKAQRAQAHLDWMKSQNQREKTQANLQAQERSLLSRLALVKERWRIAREKRVLARKALKAQNNLYNVGRADIDQVLRSEEDLIQTERGLAQALAAYYQLAASQSLLYGNTAAFLGVELR